MPKIETSRMALSYVDQKKNQANMTTGKFGARMTRPEPCDSRYAISLCYDPGRRGDLDDQGEP